MTTGKTIGLTRQTFVGKVTSLFFNMLSQLVIAFLPRSKHLLMSWLQSPSAVILEPPKIKSLTVSIVSPSICHEVMELDAISYFIYIYIYIFFFFFSCRRNQVKVTVVSLTHGNNTQKSGNNWSMLWPRTQCLLGRPP